MPLPKPPVPLYELTIPSNNKKIVYRPFLTKEEKILLMALESQDEKQILLAIKQTLKNCIQTKIKIEDLAVFDVEYIFLNTRARSIGEVIELKLTCPDDDETKVSVSINIDDIKVEKPKGHSSEIKLGEQFLIKMKYPNIDSLIDVDDESEDTIKTVAKCVGQIATEEEIYDCSQVSLDETVEFLEQLPVKQFEEIQRFFTNIPKLQHKVKVKNPNTGVESDVVIEGLYNFFG
jgi:T4 bacteriophage base plate protein